MTSFALGIWAWEKTGSAQVLALVGVFTFAPLIIVTPFVGVLVDRWNRKLVMMLSDFGAAISSVIVLILLFSGDLEIWHIYATTAFASVFQAFQWPAYSASATMMVPKEYFSRASGLISMIESASNIIAPLLAGLLIGFIGVKGILVIDLLTFLLAIMTLLLIIIPQTDQSNTRISLKEFLQEVSFGFRYIIRREGLLKLQFVFFAANFMTVIGWAVISPMVLARTGGDAQILGVVESVAAAGGLVGGLLLVIWGGPKKLVWGVLIGWILNGLLGRFLMGISGIPLVWMLSAFLLAFFIPTINGNNQAIWQKKVSPGKQGRVFATRRFIAQITIPISLGISGWLADNVFEPAFVSRQAWGGRIFGGLFGVGPGSGLSMMIALSGLLVALVGAAGLLNRRIRNVETELPDFDEGDLSDQSQND